MDGRRGEWEGWLNKEKGQKESTLKKKDVSSTSTLGGKKKAKTMNQQTPFMHLCKILHMYMCQEINKGYN